MSIASLQVTGHQRRAMDDDGDQHSIPVLRATTRPIGDHHVSRYTRCRVQIYMAAFSPIRPLDFGSSTSPGETCGWKSTDLPTWAIGDNAQVITRLSIVARCEATEPTDAGSMDLEFAQIVASAGQITLISAAAPLGQNNYASAWT